VLLLIAKMISQNMITLNTFIIKSLMDIELNQFINNHTYCSPSFKAIILEVYIYYFLRRVRHSKDNIPQESIKLTDSIGLYN